MTACSCHVTSPFQSESTLYICLNAKELLAQSRREIWSLSDCNWSRTQNHLVRKRPLNHLATLASLAKWLSVRLRTKWFWVRVQLQSLEYQCFFVFFLQLALFETFQIWFKYAIFEPIFHYISLSGPFSIKHLWSTLFSACLESFSFSASLRH